MNNIGSSFYRENKQNFNFKSTSINYRTLLPSNKLPIKEVTDFIVDISINDNYIINVSKGISNEGEISTGKTLLVKGSIISILEYITFSTSPLSSFKITVPFSILIPIPEHYSLCTNFHIETFIDFKSAYPIEERIVHNSIGLTLIIKSSYF